MEGWVGPRAGPFVEKQGRLLPLSAVEAQCLPRAAGVQVTLRYSVPRFISALPNLSPHLNGVPNGTPLAAVGAVFSCTDSSLTLWPRQHQFPQQIVRYVVKRCCPVLRQYAELPLVRDTF